MKEHEASSTAFTVVQGILYTARNPQLSHLVTEEVKDVCTRILSASQEGQRRLRQLHSWWFTLAIPAMERLMMPGITLHYVLRKRCIEDYALQTLQEGATQVINLGAGFDTLAYRLSQQYPAVNFIEIDHPATHAAKVHALSSPEAALENLRFLPVDFTTQVLEEELRAFPGFSPDQPTLFIVEGVLMYLNENDVLQLFESLKRLVHRGIRVIFTFMEPMARHPESYGPLLKLYLTIKKESYFWSKEHEQIPEFLRGQDFAVQTVVSAQELKKRYLPPDYSGRLQEGEYLAEAEYHWT